MAERPLGPSQAYATALPRQEFATENDRGHVHTASGSINTFWWNGAHSDREANHGNDFVGAVDRAVNVTGSREQSEHQHIIKSG